jgi:hypothetical protein
MQSVEVAKAAVGRAKQRYEPTSAAHTSAAGRVSARSGELRQIDERIAQLEAELDRHIAAIGAELQTALAARNRRNFKTVVQATCARADGQG